MHIFGSVELQTEYTFPFLYSIIFQRLESFKPTSSTRGEEERERKVNVPIIAQLVLEEP